MKRVVTLALFLYATLAFSQSNVINNPVLTGTITTSITGTTQCTHVSPSGVLTGTSTDCLTGNFAQLTSGTLIGQSLLVGSSASFGPTGTGTVNSNRINGAAVPANLTCLGTNASGQMVTGTCTGTGGSGTVTSFTAGSLSPLFITSVANPSTTPALTFTLSNAAQNSVFAGPAAGGAGAPSFQTAPTFSAANLTSLPITLNTSATNGAASWTPGTNTLSIPNYSTPSFAGITAGTNTGQAMLIGSGSSIGPTPTTPGTVNANQINGAAITPSLTCLGTNSSSQLVLGTCPAGTVTSFSAGTLSPLFTTTVNTATTTPALTFTLSTAAQNSVLAGPATGGAGVPSYQTAPTVSAANMTALPLIVTNSGTSGAATYTQGTNTLNIPNYTTGTGNPAFSAITNGTNTAAAMLVGTGASLGPTGTGTVSANQVNGGVIPGSQNCLATNGTGQFISSTCSFTNITSGTVSSASLAIGTGSTLTSSGTGVVNSNQVNGATIPASQTCLGSNGSSQLIAGTCTGGGAGTGNAPQSVTLSGTTPAISCASATANTITTFDFGTLSASTTYTPTWSNNCPDKSILQFEMRAPATGTGYSITWPSQFSQACQPSPINNARTKISGWWDAANSLYEVDSCVPDLGPAVMPTQVQPTGQPANASSIWCWASSVDGTFKCENNSGTITSTTVGSTVANATASVGSRTWAANACVVQTPITMTGLTTTMTANFTATSDTTTVAGWGSPTAGLLYVTDYPGAGTLNWSVCNGGSTAINQLAAVNFNVSAK